MAKNRSFCAIVKRSELVPLASEGIRRCRLIALCLYFWALIGTNWTRSATKEGGAVPNLLSFGCRLLERLSAGGMLHGAATMALFGLGTIPAMTFVGVGGSFLTLTVRRKVLTVAAWCVVLTGILSVFRGLGFIHYEGILQPPECPLCH
jgi:hypothetical protein